ncbi:hypothetical protein MAPG_08693 [Magnaporthiopsis poae ATCC 64411]|uniref:Uncharacterized protein n=1 Tax=Magnaporthiopsis poae (strain ATCC 64411 / 73-15) TaxID=644358 RepID=A0A0C4E807_MAGP6|nr:hypothetical protein MAPG_08693 [Magnaporthiopsis poae ATCC 64411]
MVINSPAVKTFIIKIIIKNKYITKPKKLIMAYFIKKVPEKYANGTGAFVPVTIKMITKKTIKYASQPVKMVPGRKPGNYTIVFNKSIKPFRIFKSDPARFI